MPTKHFAYIDIEATSADPERGHIIEIALLIKDAQGDVIDHFHALLRPPRPIPEEITELTGITNEMVANRPEFNSIAAKLFSKLKGNTLVAHKVEFDSEILKAKFRQLGMDFSPHTFCTLEQAKMIAPEMKSYSLSALCDFFDVPLKKNHRAQEDVDATVLLKETLDLLNSHIDKGKNPRRYLPKHQKLIDRSPHAPGRVFFREAQGGALVKSIACDNVHRELEERLSLSAKNKDIISRPLHISFDETGSLSKALLLETRKQIPLKWAIYSVKGHNGLTILRCGKARRDRPALLYFEDKKKALAELKRIILKSTPQNKFVYKEGPKLDKSEIAKRNRLIGDEIKKSKPEVANTLFRSLKALAGKYQYVYVDDAYHFAVFEDERMIESRKDMREELTVKKLRPSEKKALELAMLYTKNQKRKTDAILKLKAGTL